jgi:hypothetical protein
MADWVQIESERVTLKSQSGVGLFGCPVSPAEVTFYRKIILVLVTEQRKQQQHRVSHTASQHRHLI